MMASRCGVVLPALYGWLAALPFLLPAMIGRDFVQDDWFFLQQAREDWARWPGLPALLAPVPDAPFWRPLGSRIPFLIYHLAGGSHALAMGVNLALHGLGIVLAMRLIESVSRLLQCGRASSLQTTLIAFFLAAHSTFFLPVVWASGVQDLACLCWMAAGLNFFVKGLGRPRAGWPEFAAAGCCAAALLTKETGALMLPLMILIGWQNRVSSACRPWRPTNTFNSVETDPAARGKGFLVGEATNVPSGRETNGVPCSQASSRFQELLRDASSLGRDVRAPLFVIVTWFIARSILLPPAPPDSPYAWQFGANVLRNTLAFGWYLLNGPREALRFSSGLVTVLGAVAVVSSIAGLLPLFRRIRLPFFILCWLILGAAPFLPLAEQSYAYYAIPALCAFGFVLRTSRPAAPTFVLLFVAIALARISEFLAPFPAFEVRARWAAEANARIVLEMRDAPYAILESPSYPHTMALGKGLAATYRSAKPVSFLLLQSIPPNNPASWLRIEIDAKPPLILWLPAAP